MKKPALCIIFFILGLATLMAQNRQLIIKKSEKGLFVDHTVAAKEGLYSIGRTYNVHPRSIAAFNNIDMNAGLNLGQIIHIPLTDTNFSQKTNKGTPIYYTVKEKEGLLTVSNANNITMQAVRDWNNLKSDKINTGSKLIVGYLVTEPIAPPVAVNEVKKDLPPEQKPVVEMEEVALKKDEPVKANEPKQEVAKVDPPVKKQEPPTQVQSSVTKDPISTSGMGYFRSSFDQQVKGSPVSKMETVTSGIFKTTSGWQDAKYYLLIDKVQAGTIVRLTNPDNNKAVYAKVLGEMNGIRQNQGLDIRISNAAATALGISDTEKFIVKVSY